MQHKMAFGAIAAASASAGLLFGATPAMAQSVADVSCLTGILSYPPGLAGGAINSTALAAGDTLRATTRPGVFTPVTSVTVTVDQAVTLGTVTADRAGRASINQPLPSSLQPGLHTVLFTGVLNGQPSAAAVCITSTAAGAPIGGGAGAPATNPVPPVNNTPIAGGGQVPANTPIAGGGQAPAARPSALPFTGSAELVTLAGLGVGLVVVGAGTVVLARRRRSEAPLAV